jgi:aromatic ring-cleaving dioxygenase
MFEHFLKMLGEKKNVELKNVVPKNVGAFCKMLKKIYYKC